MRVLSEMKRPGINPGLTIWRLISRFRLSLILLLSAVSFSVMIVMRFEVVADLQRAESSGRENHTWTIGQVEADIVRYIDALQQASDNPTSAHVAEVFKRFDTLSGRVDTLGFILATRMPELVNRKGWLDLAGPAGLLKRHEALIDPIYEDFRNTDHTYVDRFSSLLPRMTEDARRVAEGMRTVVVNAYLGTTSQVTELRNDLDKTLDLFSASLVVAMTLIGGLMLALHSQARERLRMLQKTEKEVRSFKATLDSSLDAVFVVDTNGKIIWGNAASKKVFGFEMTEGYAAFLSMFLQMDLHHRTIRDIIPPPERKRVRMMGKRADGEAFPVDVSGAFWSDGSAEEVMVFFIRDISEQVSFEDHLAAARNDALKGEEAKARFLAVMSHEMRTPLNGLLAAADLMTRKVNLSGDAARFTSIMRSCALQTLDHINNVLELTRLEDQHGAHYGRSTLPLLYFLRAIVVQFEAEAEQRGLKINFKADGDYDDIKIEGIPTLLRRVVANFLSNAVKFTDEGHIDVLLSILPGQDEDWRTIRISIQDTGVGIAERDLERIFQTFETLDASFARVREGSGLGLGIAKLAAEAMGGHIEVESRARVGSTFTLVFDAHLSSEQIPEETRANPQSKRHLRILVAEDNRTSRELLVEMLSLNGHSVEAAEDGVEAVTKAHLEFFDVILMDLAMPHLDGLAATRLIKDQSLNSATPIIGLTAQADLQMQQTYLDAGLLQVILKPASLEQIENVLFGIEVPEGEIDAEGIEVIHMESLLHKMRVVGVDKIRLLSAGCLMDSLESAAVLETLPEDDLLARSIEIAHREAGGVASLGFLELQREWLGIQTAGKHGDFEGIRSGTSRVRGIVSETRTLLEDVFREASLETT